MKHILFLGVLALSLFASHRSVCYAATEISVDKSAIQALLADKSLTVSLSVRYARSAPVQSMVRITLEDLEGQVLGESSMRVDLNEITQNISMVVNAQVDREKLAAYVVRYAVKTDSGETIEGRKSLFYMVQQLDTQLLMQQQFYTRSQAAVRIVVADPSTHLPLAGASVRIRLGDTVVFQGETAETGTLDAQFLIPESLIGKQQLRVDIEKNGAEDVLEQTVTIQDVYSVLVTTDKPLYQPGQRIHIRSLALRKPDLLPVENQEMLFEVEDSKGNKVFKQAVTTDDFGISSAEFQLAHELNEGTYRLRAIFGQSTTEKTVTVERYVLPKFKLEVETDQRYYKPGQRMTGDVQVDYFFGKPVSGGTVIMTLAKFDTEFEIFAELKGKTDAQGHYQFETQLPDYFVGQPLEQGAAFVKIEVAVVDTAEHEEKKTLTRSIASDPLHLVVIPESGSLVPGLENIFYVAASYPDGTPAETSLTIQGPSGSPLQIQTDASGIAEFQLTPREHTLALNLTAQDATGIRVAKTISLTSEAQQAEQILLRMNKALYQVGETMTIDVFATFPHGTVYLDLIKDGQTFLTRALDLEKGHGSLDLALPVAGTLQVHAYKILPSSDIIRDTRVLYVEAADELQIGVSTDKPTYLPGEDARIQFSVTNGQGHPVLAALGITIVDESVFALQELQPGLEKIYFMLEQELMTPRYEIHAYSMEHVVTDGPFLQKASESSQQVREKAAQVLLASAEHLVTYDVRLNTFAEKLAGIRPLIQEKVFADFQKIYQAIDKFSKKRKKVLTAKEGISRLVEEGLLQPEDLLDPWGNAYRVSPQGKDFLSHTFLCLGPDETENTADDIWLNSYIDMRRERSFFDWILRRGDDDFFMLEENMDIQRRVLPMAAGPGVAMEKAEMLLDASESEASAPEESSVGPRIRQYFPETLYVNPAVLTDAQGKASIALTMADSITTWRLTSMASSLTGTLGSGTSAIRVFQDFFVDIALPVTLTQNDQVSIPIAIYNYLPGEQNVQLKLTEEPWFELVQDIPEKTITLTSGQVDVVYFTLKVTKIGWHKLTVHAYGSSMSDAISRPIEVLPDGEQIEMAWNGRLDDDVTQTVSIPKDALEDASKILVKVYPGIFSQIVEGLDGILRMPSGCFEQTSSATYPNVLVLDYMKQANQITPEIQMKAEGFINTGYQRLLSYEVNGGGFEWFGRAPAHKILTAYGLMEFYDMAQVFTIDPNVITRTQQWLVSQQDADGSWKPAKEYLDVVAAKFADDVMRNTAYITWALLATGYNGDAVEKALAYMREHLDGVQDTYTLALVANGLVLAVGQEEMTSKLLDTLLRKKHEQEGKVWWEADSDTSTNASGLSANIETTALVGLAFMKSEKYHDTVSKILNYLIESKDAHGTWHSTQATILAMKALLLSMKNATSQTDAEVTIRLNNRDVERIALTPENSDVMRLFDLKDLTVKGDNQVQIQFDGRGSALYQIVGRYYLPWKATPVVEQEPMSIAVVYDKTELVQNDVLTAHVTVRNNRPAQANMVIVDLGVPPGFDVQAGDLAEAVDNGTISRFNLTGRQIIVYLDAIKQQAPVEFSYRLKAKFPVKAKTPKSTVYEYYNPAIKADVQPQEILVSE